MNVSDPQFWMMISSIVTAICFIFMAVALVVVAVLAKKALRTVNEVQLKVEPLIDQVNQISAQGKDIAVQFNELSVNLNSASRNFAAAARRSEPAEAGAPSGVRNGG